MVEEALVFDVVHAPEDPEDVDNDALTYNPENESTHGKTMHESDEDYSPNISDNDDANFDAFDAAEDDKQVHTEHQDPAYSLSQGNLDHDLDDAAYIVHMIVYIPLGLVVIASGTAAAL